MFATSAPVLSAQQLDWQFPLVHAEFFTHKLSAPANAIAQSHDWLVVAVGRTIMLHRFKQLDWSQPHREFSIGFIPQHLLLAGMDSRYIIAINTDGYYEVYDRVSLDTVQHGRFSHHSVDSQYQIVSQQYLLASSGSNLYLYSTTSMAQALMQFSMPGKVCAVAFHQASSTFYCVSQNDRLHITPIQVRSGIQNRLPSASYPMQFVGLSYAGNHLMLQALRIDGHLRLMTYDLPDLQLVAVQEKSLAYQGLSNIHPTQPWAATDLGNGLLIWDTQRFTPIALLQFPPPLVIKSLVWLDSGQLLFIHGDTIELWAFRSTETPFLNGYNSQTVKALQDFRQWVNRQRSTVGMSFIVGEASVGKTAIAQAFSEYNFANTWYIIVPEIDDAEIKTILLPYFMQSYRQIFLDQAENLSLELTRELHQIAQQAGISLVLITRYLPDIGAAPVYEFFPIKERVDLGNVAAYFAPQQGRHRHYLMQIKSILEASARRRMMQATN